jgi:Flp pilus assembly protein TadD
MVLCLTVAACAQLGTSQLDLDAPAAKETADKTPAASGSSELAKATEYWGKEFAKNPRDAKAALNYALNLKAMGEKRQALTVLQQASLFHAKDRAINSEYGRLALEFDQVSAAEKLLAHADDPANPDWRVISARGTVLAKQGRYSEALPFYERALTLSPDQPSILSNLALAHTMEGHPERAEPLLKRAAAAGTDARVAQNLALVLGLQGKYEEAKQVAARDLPADDADASVDYLRRIVMLEPLPPPAAVGSVPAKRPAANAGADAGGGWATKVAVAPGK